MGRDAGWLAGSTVVTGRVDLIVLPEVDFDKEKFLAQVKKCMDEKENATSLQVRVLTMQTVHTLQPVKL